MRSLHPATAAALGVALLGCNAAQSLAPTAARQLIAPGLQQTVRLIPAVPASGDQIQIVSVVTNRSADSVAVTSRICGLDTAGDLVLVTARMACAGYGLQVALAPGDSVAAGDVRVVASPPGRYTLRVRQLLAPPVWLDVPLVVR
jgi:hypothetical protein